MSDIAEVMSAYANEVNVASSSFYAWKSLNNVAVNDRKALLALNKNALSWNIVAHSMQVTFFIAIGRIFDRDTRSLTVHRFLSECKTSLDQFNKGSFERRRLQSANGMRPDYLDDFLKTVYEPTADDFALLEKSAASWADIYRQKCAPVRHKVIAHRDFATIGSTDTLYANTNIGEFEGMLSTLYRIGRVVWELHTNGRLTKMEEHKFDEEVRYRKDLEDLIKRL